MGNLSEGFQRKTTFSCPAFSAALFLSEQQQNEQIDENRL